MKYHPDRNKEAGAEERFKRIAEAYAILSDPQKRANYDARGFAGVANFSEQDLFGGINFDDLFGGLNQGFVGFGGSGGSGGSGGGLFDRFFNRQRRPAGSKRGADIEASVLISLERVNSGGDEAVRLRRPATCSACHGTGASGGAARRRCDACQGSGRQTLSQREDANHVLIQRIVTCSSCLGRGSIVDCPCPACSGSGQHEQEETLQVKIPRGVEENMVLRVSGKGMPSPDPGSSGDLLLTIRSQRDPRFERSGADLIRRESIALTDAVLGATLQVPTLSATASVSVPPGTQPGAILRLKGKGLPIFGKEQYGDLYLHIAVQVPEKLSGEERKLYARLRELSN